MRTRQLGNLLLIAVAIVVPGCGNDETDPPGMMAPAPAAAPGSIEGRALFRDLEDHSGISISLGSRTTTTDANGLYRFSNLANGTYSVVATASSTREIRLATSILVTGERTLADDLWFSPLGVIDGVVRFENGIGRVGISVVVADTPAYGVSDERGHYTIENVPAGPRLVHASAEGYLAAAPALVTVQYDHSAQVPDLILLPALQGDASIKGSVVRSGWPDGSGVRVALTGPVARTTITDGMGSYFFSDLPAGPYILQVGARTLNPFELGPGDTIELPPVELIDVGALVGYVTVDPQQDRRGIAVVAVSAGHQVGMLTDDTGLFVFVGLPTGEYSITATRSGLTTGSTTANILPYQTTFVPDLALSVAAP